MLKKSHFLRVSCVVFLVAFCAVSCGVRQQGTVSSGGSLKSSKGINQSGAKSGSSNANSASQSTNSPSVTLENGSVAFSDASQIQQQVLPPELSMFKVAPGTSSGAIKISLGFPADISNIGTVKIVEKPGNSAPANCMDGLYVKEYQSAPESLMDEFEYKVENPLLSYSYRACIYFKDPVAGFRDTQIVESVLPYVVKILTGIDIRDGNSCDIACADEGLSCVSTGLDGEATNNVYHYSQGRLSKLSGLWDGKKSCKDYYGQDGGSSCGMTVQTTFDDCIASGFTNCRCGRK